MEICCSMIYLTYSLKAFYGYDYFKKEKASEFLFEEAQWWYSRGSHLCGTRFLLFLLLSSPTRLRSIRKLEKPRKTASSPGGIRLRGVSQGLRRADRHNHPSFTLSPQTEVTVINITRFVPKPTLLAKHNANVTRWSQKTCLQVCFT